MQQRISEWLPVRADGQGLNNYVLPYEQRADKGVWPIGADKVIWRIKDAFTVWQAHGGWDPNPGYKWTIPQWARDSYLTPMDDPHHCDAGGGDHNIIVALLDKDGQFMPAGAGVIFWWYDALTAPNPQSPTDQYTVRQLDGKGWCDIPMDAGWNYHWETGQHGPGKVCKVGAADVWVGCGLPYPNEHLTTVLVYQAEVQGTTPPPVEPPPVEPPPVGGTVLDLVNQLEEGLGYLTEVAASLRALIG